MSHRYALKKSLLFHFFVELVELFWHLFYGLDISYNLTFEHSGVILSLPHPSLLPPFCIMYPHFSILYLVSCILYPVSYILYPVSCILYHVSSILHLVSCILYPVSCILYFASCILHPVSHLPYSWFTVLRTKWFPGCPGKDIPEIWIQLFGFPVTFFTPVQGLIGRGCWNLENTMIQKKTGIILVFVFFELDTFSFLNPLWNLSWELLNGGSRD